MEEERVMHLLHELPRERALGGFTAQVLRRLDEEARARPRRRAQANRFHRLMVATATVAALGVSVGLLQREHAPGPLTASLAPAREQLAAALPAPARQEARLRLGALPAMSRGGAGLDAAQAQKLVHELRLEQARLERELRSLRRPAARGYAMPPAIVYLGGDENVDLVINTGRMRALQAAPLAERDDGENNNNYLD
jgi:hypothetical protein